MPPDSDPTVARPAVAPKPAGRPSSAAPEIATPTPAMGWIGVARPAAALLGLFLFVLALQLIKAGANGLVPILDGLNIAGPMNAVGFGFTQRLAATSFLVIIGLCSTSAGS